MAHGKNARRIASRRRRSGQHADPRDHARRDLHRARTDLAPGHAERLKQLAREGFYDDVPFHRVIDGFMAQTGDGQHGNGTGGS